MKCTYKVDHPLNKNGKAHPQSPPLHLHFDQSESFRVVQGRVGTTLGWSATDRIFIASDGAYEIQPWVPHRFWPVAPELGQEDCILLLWSHPKDVPESMDDPFFETLLRYLSGAYERRKMPNLFLVMLTQHVSATALVVFPKAWWLGPLRWWLPWMLQGGIAALARLLGYKPLRDEFIKRL